jgi:Kelch motif
MLSPMPQGSTFGGSAVYKGRLYCFGGWASFSGSPLNNVLIYQPLAEDSGLAFT